MSKRTPIQSVQQDFNDLFNAPTPARPTEQKWRVTRIALDGTETVEEFVTPYDRQHTVMLDAVKALSGCVGYCKIHKGHSFRKLYV